MHSIILCSGAIVLWCESFLHGRSESTRVKHVQMSKFIRVFDWTEKNELHIGDSVLVRIIDSRAKRGLREAPLAIMPNVRALRKRAFLLEK